MPAVNAANRTSVAPGGAAVRAIALAVATWIGGGVACVDTGGSDAATPSGAVDAPVAVPPATCDAAPPVPYPGDAAIPLEDQTAPGPYLWKNVVIEGGGFVSGIIMSPVLPGLAFARTDVGGAYRYDPAGKRWMAITDWVGHADSNLGGIESIAADPVDPNRVYIAAGMYVSAGNGKILRSTDMGQTWASSNIGAPMGGNADGRSMGERLAIDPNLPSILYFGSRTAGLWASTDSAQTWTQVTGFPTTGVARDDAGVPKGYGLTFVFFDSRTGSPGSPTPVIYVGVGATTEAALYRSTDAGATWEAVAGQPTGMMPHHVVQDGCCNLYFAYNNGAGPNNISSGAVWRYGTVSGSWIDVKVPGGGGGFGGLAADANNPGTLLVTTIDRWTRDEIYRTTDGGAHWTAIGSVASRDVGGAVWVLGHQPTMQGTPGWMGDVEIDPFNPGRALYITGSGIWSTDNLTNADIGAPTSWTFDNAGLEETVVIDLISPPAGVPLLSAVGDVSGFRHADLDVSPASGMLDGYGSTSSLDFAEAAPNVIARVGSSGAQRGSYSIDGGVTWIPFATAPKDSKGSGSIAISADGATFLWAAQGATPAYSQDSGATWTPCVGAPSGSVRVAADRVNPLKFYANGRNASGKTVMFVSTDGGKNFAEIPGSPSGRPRPVFGIEGDVWVVTNSGLVHSTDSAATFAPVPPVSGATAPVPQVTGATGVGFGMAAPGQSYPAVYLAGAVANVWGTYRSDDAGVTWQRIDDPQHQFGWIQCLTGDPRRYGRVYLGTGGRGIVYGDQR